jgi:hypothetical protein
VWRPAQSCTLGGEKGCGVAEPFGLVLDDGRVEVRLDFVNQAGKLGEQLRSRRRLAVGEEDGADPFQFRRAQAAAYAEGVSQHSPGSAAQRAHPG